MMNTVLYCSLIGNSLSFLVMTMPHNRHISCCVYMAWLSVSDNLLCCNAYYFYMVTYVFNTHMSLVECKLIAYFFHVSGILPNTL